MLTVQLKYGENTDQGQVAVTYIARHPDPGK